MDTIDKRRGSTVSLKREYSSEDDEDFAGFDDVNGSQNSNKEDKKTTEATETYYSEEVVMNLYNSWDSADKSSFKVNALYKKPFDYGWKRELVYRAVTGASKEKGEVYYITPSGGKKLRTKSELQANLSDGLTMENFTFNKCPLFIGPGHEIIRSAKPKNSPAKKSASIFDVLPPREGKRIPKPKAPKGASPPPASGRSITVATSTKITPRTSLSSKTAATIADKRGGGNTSLQKAKGGEPCTIQCILAMGAIPQLLCTKCLCLYHHECVGVTNKSNNSYVCQSCESGSQNHNNGKVTNEPIPPSPQTLATIKGRRFIVVPKSIAPKDSPPIKWKKQKRSDEVEPAEKPETKAKLFHDASLGYAVLLDVFQYLKVQELLSVSRVCRLFNQIANHSSLWRTVRMKNSLVSNFSGFANTLRRNGTKHLDMRKMLIASNSDEIWESFLQHIGTVEHLETIELCRCPAFVVERLFTTNPKLRILNALQIKGDDLNLEVVKNATELTELRLKPENWMKMTYSLNSFEQLTKLRHLVLIFFMGLDEADAEAIGCLTNLESLEIGDCSELSIVLSDHILPKLTKLSRLRMEKGEAECGTIRLIQAVAKMPALVQLELVNFDIKPEFDKEIIKCVNVRKLLIIPTYISQSASTNHMILSGVIKMVNLTAFTWVVTLQLLRVTTLYVDQVEEEVTSDKRDADVLPILKPVPGIFDDLVDNEDVQQVEIVPLSKVESILHSNLPNTFIKIVKAEFDATWRLNLVEA